jgi:glucose/arabinose dehydrogenase
MLLKNAATILAISVSATALSASASAAGELVAIRVASDLERPVYVGSPRGDADRLFILEQHAGEIKILQLGSGTINPTPFLVIENLAIGSEQGLLGMAFHPNYAVNGFFYVNFTVAGDGATHIVRYSASNNSDIADPNSARRVMTIDQPFGNHNGGWLAFGPDGYLYIGAGDGGSGNDPSNNAQDVTNNLLGKILRIDVDGDDFPGDPERTYAVPPDNPFVGIAGDDEIWVYGLRNPWRASFDRTTGDLYIGDVGQSGREEVNFQSAQSVGGENYGWRIMEGTRCNIDTDLIACDSASLTPPIHEYAQGGAPDGGCSIIGGFVYRGPISELAGLYIFGDFCSSQIWSLRYDGADVTEFANCTADITPDIGSIDGISSFGEDDVGNLYVVDLDGELFVLASPSASPTPSPSPLPSATPVPSPDPTETPAATASPQASPIPSPTPATTPGPIGSPTPTADQTASPIPIPANEGRLGIPELTCPILGVLVCCCGIAAGLVAQTSCRQSRLASRYSIH